jgi:plasmid maintenance system antidote protein VapI
VTPIELARLQGADQGKRSIIGDTALRLGHWFGTGD